MALTDNFVYSDLLFVFDLFMPFFPVCAHVITAAAACTTAADCKEHSVPMVAYVRQKTRPCLTTLMWGRRQSDTFFWLTNLPASLSGAACRTAADCKEYTRTPGVTCTGGRCACSNGQKYVGVTVATDFTSPTANVGSNFNGRCVGKRKQSVCGSHGADVSNQFHWIPSENTYDRDTVLNL
jgi:hypothetical protein